MFNVAAVKQAHLAWSGKLEQVIRGRIEMQPEQVTSGHECEFGKWYDSQGRKRMGENPLAEQIGQVHLEVHDTAKVIAELVSRNIQDDAESRMRDFHGLLQKLFSLLDEVYLQGSWDDAKSLPVGPAGA